MAEFITALAVILKLEGGYSFDPDDRGGETNYGITKSEAVAFGYVGDLKDIPQETVEKIYKLKYWDMMNCDKIHSQIIAERLFNMGVNMGNGTAGKFLQRALNNMNKNNRAWSDLNVDGIIGSATVDVLNNLNNADEEKIEEILQSYQIAYYCAICEKDPTQKKFLRGWINRANNEA